MKFTVSMPESRLRVRWIVTFLKYFHGSIPEYITEKTKVIIPPKEKNGKKQRTIILEPDILVEKNLEWFLQASADRGTAMIEDKEILIICDWNIKKKKHNNLF